MGPLWWIAAGMLLVSVVLALVWVRRLPPAMRRAGAGVVLGSAVTLIPNVRDAGIVVAVLAMSAGYLAGMFAVERVLARATTRSAPGWQRAVRRARVAVMRMPGPVFGLAIFGTMLVAGSVTSWLLFRHLPVIQDTQAQLLHARIFLTGALAGPAPPAEIAEFFEAEHVIVRHAVYSQYPPGHTVMLAIGLVLGAPWAVNPALGGLALVLVWRIGRALWNERTGRRAALLGLTSPFILLMSSEYMNHSTMLVLFAVQVLGTVHALGLGREGTPSLGRACAWALAAGIAMGWSALVRPLSALALAAPLGVLAVLRAFREPRRFAAPMLVIGLVAVAIAALMLPFNVATTGAPFLMGYIERWGPNHTIGFGISPWGPVHTPARGVAQTLSNLDAWNLFLLGGPLPATLLVALGFARDHRRSIVRALLACPIAVLGLYFFYFGQDLTFGPRYLYESSLFGLLMISRALGWLPSLLARAEAVSRRALSRGLLGIARAVAIAFALVFFLPGIAWEYRTTYAVDGGIFASARAEVGDRRAIVFVEDDAYRRVFHAMEPTFSTPLLFARDLGDQRNRDLACHYPEHALYVHRDGQLREMPRPSCE